MIKVILFDLDDTLYNEKYFVCSGFMEVAEYFETKYGLDRDILYRDMLNILDKRGRRSRWSPRSYPWSLPRRSADG